MTDTGDQAAIITGFLTDMRNAQHTASVKTVVLRIELPVEEADKALEVFGGWVNPAFPIPVAIAKVVPEAVSRSTRTGTDPF